jgi:hypothetical protein
VWPGSGRVHEHTTRLTRRWALALRPKHHPRSDQSGHVEQPACRTRCPKEPHAQRSWHLQRSPPAQSEDLPPEVWLPTLSDDERLVEEHARSRGVEVARQRESCNACAPSQEICVTTNTPMPAPAPTRIPAAGATTSQVTKQVFRIRYTLAPCPPPRLAMKTQGARAHPPIPLDRPCGTPSVHSGRFPPLTGGTADECFL